MDIKDVTLGVSHFHRLSTGFMEDLTDAYKLLMDDVMELVALAEEEEWTIEELLLEIEGLM